MFACFLIAGRVQGATAEFAGYALAIAMGSFSFYVIETPFLKLKNHVGHQTQPLEVFRRLSRISGDA
jgi:peptidoglycan/LPS O-acetylase OafA/YrhL